MNFKQFLLLEIEDGTNGMTIYHTGVFTPSKKTSPEGKSWKQEVLDFYNSFSNKELEYTPHYEDRKQKRLPEHFKITKEDLGTPQEFLRNVFTLLYYDGKLVGVTVDIFNMKNPEYKEFFENYVLTIVLSNVPLAVNPNQSSSLDKQIPNMRLYNKVFKIITGFIWKRNIRRDNVVKSMARDYSHIDSRGIKGIYSRDGGELQPRNNAPELKISDTPVVTSAPAVKKKRDIKRFSF